MKKLALLLFLIIVSSYISMAQTIKCTIMNGDPEICQNGEDTYVVSCGTCKDYVWSVSAGTILSGQGTNQVTVKWTTPGNQTLSINASCQGAWDEDSQSYPYYPAIGIKSVTVNDQPSVPVVASKTLCGEGSTTLTVSNSNSSYTYHWYDASGGGVLHTGTSYTTGILSSQKSYKIRATNGVCSSDWDNAVVYVKVGSMYNVTGGGSYCEGGPGITVFLDNSQVGVEYQLKMKGASTGVSRTGDGSMLIWKPKIAGEYEVFGVDGTCEVKMNGSATVTVNPLPTVDAGAQIEAFTNSTVTLNGENPAGGTWSGSGVFSGNKFSNSTAGQYTVTYNYIDSNGCTDNDTRLINLRTLPTISYLGETVLIQGSKVTLTADESYSGYQWYKDGQIIPGENNLELDVTEAGSYYLKGTTGQGYSANSSSINIDYSLATDDLNYIMEWTPKISVTSEAELEPDINVLDRNIHYFDGLGRPMQTVSVLASPSKEDIVQPIKYDAYGRQNIHYLPYAEGYGGLYKANDVAAQGAFYSNEVDVAHDIRPFSEQEFEPSPLNRVSTQYGPGQAWKDGNKRIVFDYEINIATEVVEIWDVSSSDQLQNIGNYAPGQLQKTITTDEENHQTIEFVNKLGRTILKRVQVAETLSSGYVPSEWADTYYIFDDFGNLRFVLPPMANQKLTEGATIDDTFLAQWAYQYKYDHRNRLIEKRVPGADWVYMVYDNRDRLVLTQDGNQRIKGEWLFTKYDALNRPIATGVYEDGADRVAMQDKLDRYYDQEIVWTQFQGSEVVDGLLKSTAANGWGNAGASTGVVLQNGQDGTIHFETKYVNDKYMIGFSDVDTDAHYNTIDYAIYINQSVFYVYENGVKKWDTGYLDPGDVFQIERKGNEIRYKRNGNTFHITSNVQTGPLIVDAAIYFSGDVIKMTNPQYHETRSSGHFDYSDLTFPQVKDDNSFLSVTYYDDYDFHHAALPDFAFIPDEDHSTYFNRVKGLVTGTKTRILGDDRWISTVNYYDDKYRVIQTVSNNHKEGTERMSSTYDFVGKVLESKLTHFQPMKVTWKNLVGAQATGNFLTSTSAGNWSSGASSANTLAENEDGWLQTMVSETTHNKFIGFNEYDDSHTYQEIDYAVYVYQGSLRAYRNGVQQSTIGAIKPGDYIRMERVNGEVRVLLNNELRYTFADLSTTKLLIDVSFYTAPATFSYVTCSFGIPETKAPYPILWTGMNANALTRADSLTKTGPSGWNAGASSINKLLPGESGWLEFTTKQNNTNFLVGLSDRDEGIDLATIDYAIYFRYEGVFRVYENGNHLGEYGTYAAGDVFKIERTGQTISYLKNGQVFKTSDVPSVSGLIADVTLHGEGTTITNVKASFGYTSPTETQTDITRSYDYDHAGRLLKTYHEVTETIQWVQRNNTTVNGNTIEKTSGTDYVWDAGAESSNILPAGRDGWIEMTTDRNNRGLFFGLSEYSADDHWNTIDNAFYLTGGGQVQIRRAPSGTNFLGYARGYAAGDKFRIERKDTDLHFYHNGELIHTRSGVANTNLKVDISFYQLGSRITDAKMGFGKVLLSENHYNELGELIEKNLHSENESANFSQSVDYRYNIRGWLKSINNADLSDGERDLFGMELAYNENWAEVNNNPAFNGNISAVKWSNNLGLGDLKERAYSYSYDPLNRIKEAQHHRQLINTWGSVGDYSVSNLSYDLNGNITDLTRNGIDRVIDQISYTYKGNQLQYAEDQAGWEGFKDGHAGSDGNEDYLYDSDGNMIVDKNKGITSIEYNYLKLPVVVTKDNGEYMKFIYDAAGVKLGQEVYDASGNLKKRIDYIGEFIYENDTLQFIHHDEGRVVANEGNGFEYQYYHKDQLGNTRLVFTTRPKSYEFIATMELDKSVEEESMFSNVVETRETFVGAAQSPDKVAMLTSAQPVGPGLSLPVNPGDTVRMEGYAYFEGGNGYSNGLTLEALVTAVAGAFGGVNGGTEAQQAIYNSFDNAYGIIGLNGTGDDNVPAAYLNYILFDKNMTYQRSGFKQISNVANFSKEHVIFNDDIIVSEPGFIYCYVTMESALGVVYWDDFKVTLNESAVVQMQDFYPFGMTSQNYERVNLTSQRFKFNGKERITDLNLGWDDFGARMYMPDLGRWGTIDPLADKMRRWSTYTYAFNNPIRFIDPDGMAPTDPNKPPKHEKVLKSPVGNAPVTSGYKVNREVKTAKGDGSSPHRGIDYGVPTGTSVKAIASGTVVRAEKSSTYGNVVIIDHGKTSDSDKRVYTLYAHNSNLTVEAGDEIEVGQEIAKSGNTGISTGPHVHLGAYVTNDTPDQNQFYTNKDNDYDPTQIGDLLLNDGGGSGEESSQSMDPMQAAFEQMKKARNPDEALMWAERLEEMLNSEQ